MHITLIGDDLKKKKKNNTKGNLTIKDLVRSLANICAFSYTRLFFWRKKNLASVNNLFSHYDVFILFVLVTHINKRPMNLKYESTLRFLLFNHRKKEIHE